MLVKATKKGFIGGALRRPSNDPKDYFEVSKNAFSKDWMEEVKVKGKKSATKTVEESEVKAYNIPSEAISTLQITEPDM